MDSIEYKSILIELDPNSLNFTKIGAYMEFQTFYEEAISKQHKKQQIVTKWRLQSIGHALPPQ